MEGLQKLLREIEDGIKEMGFIEPKSVDGKITKTEAEIRFLPSSRGKFEAFCDYFSNRNYKDVKIELNIAKDDYQGRWHIKIYCENGKPNEDKVILTHALTQLKREIHDYKLRN